MKNKNEEYRIERPACVTDLHLQFLDDLRESGKTNMYGSIPYLQKVFNGMPRETASKVLAYWMNSFSDRHPR
jgi:hypothetical protein